MLQSSMWKPNTGTSLFLWGVDSDAVGAYRQSPHSEYARRLFKEAEYSGGILSEGCGVVYVVVG